MIINCIDEIFVKRKREESENAKNLIKIVEERSEFLLARMKPTLEEVESNQAIEGKLTNLMEKMIWKVENRRTMENERNILIEGCFRNVFDQFESLMLL
jgi:hypothetical protein